MTKQCLNWSGTYILIEWNWILRCSIRMSGEVIGRIVKLLLSMASSECMWKLLCVVRGQQVYRDEWDPSLQDYVTMKHQQHNT